MLNTPTFHCVALLIDADNVQLSRLEQILKIADYYGDRKICRAYGDWKQPPLSSFYNDVRKLNIECIPVPRNAKDTADKKLMIEAGIILGTGDADLFIIVSGDGDFRLLCEQIKQMDREVVSIGNNGHMSTHLQESCDIFYYIEDLEAILLQLEQTRLQEFKTLVFRALDSISCDKKGWVKLSLLGTKLHELDKGFKNRLGHKKLSAWLSDLSSQVEIKGQMVRVMDPEFFERVTLLREAYTQAQRTDGRAEIGHIGQILRKLDSRFESHFGKKKLSEWLEGYPHVFKRHENYVSLTIE
jgi:hypothetical protein